MHIHEEEEKSPFDVSADVSVVLVIVMQEVRSNATSSLCVCFFYRGDDVSDGPVARVSEPPGYRVRVFRTEGRKTWGPAKAS